MDLVKKMPSDNFLHSAGRIFYHVGVIAVSTSIALSLPAIMSFVAQNLLSYWSFIGNEKMFLVSVEIALAIFLILLTHSIRGNWRDRRISKMARKAGFVLEVRPRGFLTRRRIRQWKEKQGFGREVLFIGSTGSRTFLDPQGEFYSVLQNCREAKIMLLNPYGGGAKIRARSILNPDITPESFGEQIRNSIHFLKGLKAVQKDIRLKLYHDPPLFKLAILGDSLWLQHYHAGLDVQRMPEFLFQHDQNPASFYIPFYQYFLSRWNQTEIPEYDLGTDEMIYRDADGNVVKREKFERPGEEETDRKPENASGAAEATVPLPPEKEISLLRPSSSEIFGQGHFLLYQKILPKSVQLFQTLKRSLKI
jgi:hypothetical protein